MIPQSTLTPKQAEMFPVPTEANKICIILYFSVAYLFERYLSLLSSSCDHLSQLAFIALGSSFSPTSFLLF